MDGDVGTSAPWKGCTPHPRQHSTSGDGGPRRSSVHFSDCVGGLGSGGQHYPLLSSRVLQACSSPNLLQMQMDPNLGRGRPKRQSSTLASRAQLLMQQVRLPPRSYIQASSSHRQSRKSEGDKAASVSAPSAPEGLVRPRTRSSPGELCAPGDSAQPCTLLHKVDPTSLSAPSGTRLQSLKGSLSSLADGDHPSCTVPYKAVSLSHVADTLTPLPQSDTQPQPILKPHSTAVEGTEEHCCEGLPAMRSSATLPQKTAPTNTTALNVTEEHPQEGLPAGTTQPLPSPFRHTDASHVLHLVSEPSKNLLSEPPNDLLSEPLNALGKKQGAHLSRVLFAGTCSQAAQDFGPGNLGSQQPQSQRSSTAGLLKSKHSSSQDAERSLQSTRPSSASRQSSIGSKWDTLSHKSSYASISDEGCHGLADSFSKDCHFQAWASQSTHQEWLTK